MPTKKITAKFETLDMAELAAHGITNNFRHISNIRIRYKNMPQEVHEEHEGDSRLSREAFFAAVPSGSMQGAGPYPFLFAGLDAEESRKSIPEIEQTTESRMIIEAGEQEARQIAGKLRCLGGYEVEIV